MARTNRWLLFCSVCALLSASSALAADPPTVAPKEMPADARTVVPSEAPDDGQTTDLEEATSFSLLDRKYMLGDLGGLRQNLDDAGFKYNLIIGNQTSINFRGGANTDNTLNNGARVFHIFQADLEKMGLAKGASLYVRVVQEWGDGLRGDVGSLSHPYWLLGSRGEIAVDLDKYWWKQQLFDGKLEFRLGKLLTVVDLVDRNAYAANYLNQFLNQALNYNLTIPVVRSLGAYVRVEPTDWLYVFALAADADYAQTTCSHGAGGFDTAFGKDAHYVTQGEFGIKAKFAGDKGELPGNYRAGWWYNPRPKNVYMNDLGGRRATRTESGDVGFYVNFDQMVWKENDAAGDQQGLGVFARYGFAHGDVNAIEHVWSLGASYLGPIPDRDEDVLGFGMAQSIMSKDLRGEVNPLADRETVYELYYAFKVSPWCVITPDVQVITNPGGNKDARDSILGGIRVKLAL